MPGGVLFCLYDMTKIESLHYTTQYVRIDLDNGESLKISLDASLQYKVSSGNELSTLELQQLKEEAERYGCKSRALSWLAMRSRSTFEMEQYLRKKGFSDYIIAEVIEKLRALGYLNDHDFAVNLVKSKLRQKTVGSRVLKNELYRKGIPRDLIAQAMEEGGGFHTDEEKIFALAVKKYRSLKDTRNASGKLYQFLAQRGFDPDIIKNVVRRVLREEAQTDPEEE